MVHYVSPALSHGNVKNDQPGVKKEKKKEKKEQICIQKQKFDKTSRAQIVFCCATATLKLRVWVSVSGDIIFAFNAACANF